MLEQSTRINCRTYQGRGTVVLKYEQRTEQFQREQISHQTTTVTLGCPCGLIILYWITNSKTREQASGYYIPIVYRD